MELPINHRMATRRASVIVIRRIGIIGGLLALMFCGLLSTPLAAEEAVSKEYQLKAAFLFNFAKYVEWPARSFENGDSPIVIGVLRKNPFGGELEKAVYGRKINGRRIVVVLVASAVAARKMHLLFVGGGQDATLDELKGGAVLTVGESETFAKRGGMITFIQIDDSLRFAINRDSAQQTGLKISSQLQKLAAKSGGGGR